MIQRQNDGQFLDDLRSWLQGVPVLCDFICKDHRGERKRSLAVEAETPGRAWSGSRQWRAEGKADPSTRPAGGSSSSREVGKAKDDSWRDELEAELESDLQRLAKERTDGLHRLDWELAEAMESLHAETARRANERIARHRAALAELERRERAGEDITAAEAKRIREAHEGNTAVEDESSNDGGSDEEGGSGGGGSESEEEEQGYFGSFVRLITTAGRGAQRRSHSAGSSRSGSDATDGSPRALPKEGFQNFAPPSSSRSTSVPDSVQPQGGVGQSFVMGQPLATNGSDAASGKGYPSKEAWDETRRPALPKFDGAGAPKASGYMPLDQTSTSSRDGTRRSYDRPPLPLAAGAAEVAASPIVARAKGSPRGSAKSANAPPPPPPPPPAPHPFGKDAPWRPQQQTCPARGYGRGHANDGYVDKTVNL